MEHLTDLLVRESRGLGLDLSPRELGALEQHLHLLAKWNAKLNLVGPGTLDSWAQRHVIDSLAIVDWIGSEARIVDVGSGAGFPGIPCAILRPASRVVLLEPRANRAAFLQSVIAATNLRNTSVRVARAEKESERFDLVIGRAVAPPAEWGNLAAKLCGPGGRFVLFASGEPPEMLGTAERETIKSYSPGLGPKRSVALYVPRGT